MPRIQLEELVLLSCEFEMWPERDEDASTSSDADYPRERLLRWRSSTRREAAEVYLYVDAALDDARLPFRLRFDMGFRFEVEDEEFSVADLEPTLLWLAYPYLREFVADLTNRSPVEAYHLPPLTRLPDPRIREDDA